jgi:FKBP-type peptidyl-prolyl cis-trans isomerase
MTADEKENIGTEVTKWKQPACQFNFVFTKCFGHTDGVLRVNQPAQLFLIAAVGVFMASPVDGQTASNGMSQAGSPVAGAASADTADRPVFEAWGWLTARDQKIAGIAITEPEIRLFLHGFTANLRGQPAPCNLQKGFPDVETLERARREKIITATREKNEAAARVFFNGLKRNTNVVVLSDHVWCDVMQRGSGPVPKPGQTLTVHYTGRLIDGTEFGQMGPLDLILVTNREVCRGWTAALQRISRGGSLKLYVPPPLSETDAVRWGIPPGSTMVFKVELIDIKDTSARDLEDAQLPPAPEPEPPPPSGYSETQLIECWGWITAQSARIREYEFSDAEMAGFVEGLAAGIRDQPPPVNLVEIGPAVEKFRLARRARVRDAERRGKMDAMNALFVELKKNTNVIELADGLRYEIIRPGHGAHPRPGQIVLVDYTARLLDGTIFDQTYNEPLHIEVGSVIDGLNEGIQQASRGSRIKLFVPPWLGYGEENRSGVVAPIPANSTLIYDLELLEIQDAPRDEAAPAGRGK